MKRFLGALCLVGWFAAGCTQVPVVAGNGIGKDLDQIGYQKYWEATPTDLGLVAGEQIKEIWHLQENVYVLTDTNRLIAMEAERGLYRWSVVVAPRGERVFRPLHAAYMLLTEKLPSVAEVLNPQQPTMPAFDGLVINSSSQVLVIERRLGKVVRRINLEFGCSCAGTTDGAMFYAGSADGRYYAVSLQQGFKTWTASVLDNVAAPMEYANGMVYVAGVNGTILAVRGGRNASEPIKMQLSGAITAPFHVDERGCFVPCENGSLYAFTSDLAQRLWDHPFHARGPLRSAVQVGEKTVFQAVHGEQFYALNLVDGRERWVLPRGVQVLAVDGSDVFVRDSAGRLLQVDEILGSTKASASLRGLDLFVGNVTDSTIYAAGRSGQVVCLRPVAAGRVTAGMLKKVQP